MERYETYRNSGVEWIGEIPSNWTLRHIGNDYSIVAGATPKSDNSDYWGGNIPWVTPADYTEYQHYISHGSRSISEAGLMSCGTTIVPAGSIVISNRAPIGLVAIAKNELCTNQGCKCLVACRNDLLPEYLYWYLTIQSNTLNSLGRGTTFLELSAAALSSFWYPSPPLDEQNAIIDFLSSATSEIDSLVTDCEREVELLREYRRSVISEAITKGLNPNVPMKDSGIEWIGEIPDEWNVAQLGKLCKRVFDGPFGSNLKSNDYVDDGVRVVRLENIKYLYFDTSKESYVTPEKYKTISQHTIYPEDLIVATFITDAVKACRLPNSIGFAVNKADCLGVRTNDEIEVDYLKYYLSSCQVYDYLVTQTHGSTRQRINTKQLKTMLIAFPPINSQLRIISYLDELSSTIDALIDTKQRMIDKLREFRRSLISEAVTGKFKVPGV